MSVDALVNALIKQHVKDNRVQHCVPYPNKMKRSFAAALTAARKNALEEAILEFEQWPVGTHELEHVLKKLRALKERKP